MKSKRTVVHTFISNLTKIKGELSFSGHVRLDNELEGNIVSTSGLLIIGESSLIRGDIQAEAIVVMGTVDGSIEALDCVEVSASGKITGNILAPKVNFEPGSIFVGRCTIGSKPVVQIDENKPLELTDGAEAAAVAFSGEQQSLPETDDETPPSEGIE